jgi:hypothetical protein
MLSPTTNAIKTFPTATFAVAIVTTKLLAPETLLL